MNTLIFDDKSKHIILQIFGKSIDNEGFIVDIQTNERVVTPDGSELLAKDWAGIRRGSEIFISKDLPSLLQYASNED